MNVRRIIERRIRHRGAGVDVVGDVNAVISANVNEPGTTTRVSSKQTVVGRGGRRDRETDPKGGAGA